MQFTLIKLSVTGYREEKEFFLQTPTNVGIKAGPQQRLNLLPHSVQWRKLTSSLASSLPSSSSSIFVVLIISIFVTYIFTPVEICIRLVMISNFIRELKRTFAEKCIERRNNLLRRMAKISTIFTILVLSFKVHNGLKIFSEIVKKISRNLILSLKISMNFFAEIITLIA